jgi:hypothetical protein
VYERPKMLLRLAISELVNLAKDNPHLIIIDGDSNLLRFQHE